jgi:hypothetical protein
MKISQIEFIESSDFSFYVSFMYDGHNLTTNQVPRTITAQLLRNEVIAVIKSWEAGRAKDNFDVLKATFQGKTITL